MVQYHNLYPQSTSNSILYFGVVNHFSVCTVYLNTCIIYHVVPMTQAFLLLGVSQTKGFRLNMTNHLDNNLRSCFLRGFV